MKTQLSPPCEICSMPMPGAMQRCPHCGAPRNLQTVSGADSENIIGVKFGHLRVVSHLGDGGMGAVYKAEHVVLGTPYAVKLLHQALQDTRNIERFRREALVCSQLCHPNIVFVTDFGVHERLGIYMVMELLEGVTLEAYCQSQGQLGIWRMVHIAEQLCEGISAAHERGLIHRDMKPENIFLVPRSGERHQVKILDFGIVRLNNNAEKLTQAGAALGTPVYMAPEQIRGSDKINHSADLYSMGTIMYEMLAGVPPFMDDHQLNILRMHMAEDAAPLSSHRPVLKGTRLAKLVHAMLEKQPTARPASALVVLQQLDEALVELQERGLASAMPEASIGRSSSQSFAAPSEPQKIMGIYVQELRAKMPDSRLSQAIAQAPQLVNLEPPLFFEMAWGILTRSLLDAQFPSDDFENLSSQVVQTMALLMGYASESNNPDAIASLLGRSVKDLFLLLDEERQRVLCYVLQPLYVERYFPLTSLPDWLLSPQATQMLDLGLKQPSNTGRLSSLRSLLSFGKKN